MVKTCCISLLVLLQCLLVYTVTNYGGIRSPDSEIVFRSAEALYRTGRTNIVTDLESWSGFGVAMGKDGLLYSIYPPGEMVALAMFIPVAERLSSMGLFDNARVPYSHYVGNSLEPALQNKEAFALPDHRLRFYLSFFDILVSALGVVAFWLILLNLTGSTVASYITASIYAFATPAWNYAGSFFSEPLAIMFLLFSFRLLHSFGVLNSLLAGILLGLAVLTHLTAILFVPFFCVYRYGYSGIRKVYLELLAWSCGLASMLGLLGLYNWSRFGDIFETGRSLSADNQARFVGFLSGESVQNLSNLIFSSGKGLLIICPVLLLGLLSWGCLHSAARRLSMMLIPCILTRIYFNALYVDWHAGFGLGPRYLNMLYPFMLIPFAYWLQIHRDHPWKLKPVAVVVWACVIEQWYFALGEIFSFYHRINQTQFAQAVDVFYHDRLYTDWRYSPITHLLDFNRGPFLLQSIPLTNQKLWLIGSGIWLLIIMFGVFLLNRPGNPHALPGNPVS